MIIIAYDKNIQNSIANKIDTRDLLANYIKCAQLRPNSR